MRPPPMVRRGHPRPLGWASLVVLLLMVVKLGHAVHCDELPSNSTVDDWLTCYGDPIKLDLIKNGKEYPEVDISDFTDDEYHNFTQIKHEFRGPDNGRIFVGNLVCSGSTLTNISNIDFAVPDKNIPQSITIENNLNLEIVTFNTELMKASGQIKITVANNKLLSKESIKILNALTYKANSSYIQKFGECVIHPGEQKSFEDLEYCHYIKGDLVINSDTDRSFGFPSTVKDIQGCISIKNTNLTDLVLLNQIETSTCNRTHEITNNRALCIFPESVTNLTKKFNKMGTSITIENNSGCKGECTWKYLEKTKDEKCVIITTTVSLMATKESDNLTYLKQVEEIRGQLKIQHTELSSIDMFPNLHTVTLLAGKDYAIDILGNLKLTSFKFPSLKNLSTADPSVNLFVVDNNNPNFIVDEEEYKHWEELTNGRLKMPQKTTDIFQYHNQTQQGSGKDSDRQGKGSESEESSVGSIIGWSIGGVLIGVIVIGGGGGALTFKIVVYCKKKMKEKADEQAKRANDEMEREFARRAEVEVDLTNVPSSSVESIFEKDRLNFSVSLDVSQKTKSVSESSRTIMLKNKNAFADQYYMAQAATDFKDQMERYNLECTRTTDGVFLKILRDKFDGEPCEQEKMTYEKKVWTHNLNFTLHSIRPRCNEFPTEEEFLYDAKNFNPHALIKTCMQHSNIHLSGRVMIAALDYCLKNGSYANPFKSKDGNNLLINVPGPIHMVGDTHGSLIDIQAVFSLDPMKVYDEKGIHPILYYRYLFTGDYLDRGIFDCICFVFLMVCGCVHNTRMFFLRGNHEWMTGEFIERAHASWPQKEADDIIDKIYQVSKMLPIAAVVNNKIFATHGGITREFIDTLKKDGVKVLDDFFRKLPYPLEHPATLNNVHVNLQVQWLLWSDPVPMSHNTNPRGGGGYFNEDDVHDFLEMFNLDLLVRGHETYGFMSTFCGKLITIFANYDTDASIIGLPYIFHNSNGFKDFMNAQSKMKSLGVLRLNADGTLNVMLLRHAYVKHDERTVNGGTSYRPLKYPLPNQFHFETCTARKYDVNAENKMDQLKALKSGQKSTKAQSKKEAKSNSKRSQKSAKQSSEKKSKSKASEAPVSKADVAPKTTQKESVPASTDGKEAASKSKEDAIAPKSKETLPKSKDVGKAPKSQDKEKTSTPKEAPKPSKSKD